MIERSPKPVFADPLGDDGFKILFGENNKENHPSTFCAPERERQREACRKQHSDPCWNYKFPPVDFIGFLEKGMGGSGGRKGGKTEGRKVPGALQTLRNR